MTNLDLLFEGISSINVKSGNGNSVYKTELFAGMTQDDKKHFRTKLRRTRDKFLSAFVNAKGDKKTLQAIQKDWKKYAAQVYKSIDIICESNTDAETANLCKKFLSVMNAEIK